MIGNSLRRFFSQTTIFDKILAKQIPSKAVFEDSEVYAFEDSQPQAPVHILVIPKVKNHLTGISQALENDQALLGKLLVTCANIAKEKGLTGYRLVINEGKEGCQSVPHLHVHLIGGRQMKWPPG